MDEIERDLPAAAGRATLYVLAAMLALLLAGAAIGKLDIVASAPGRLVPRSFVKIVQPADGGVVANILVHEGERVAAGQVLLRMDAQLSDADAAALRAELAGKSLQLRRIDAELSATPMRREPGDPAALFAQIEAQWRARRHSHLDTLEQEEQALRRARNEFAAAREVLGKLQQTAPILKRQADAYADLGKSGFAGQVMVDDKQREYLERAQDLRAQQATLASLGDAIAQSERRLAQITSTYRSNLLNERVEADGQNQKLLQDWARHRHRAELLDLRAPQAGVIKDLATHTVGSVVAPGTILLTLVPENEPLMAEVRVGNDDVGFVHEQQAVKVKLAAYPFQKYGMLDGRITHLGADAQEGADDGRGAGRASSGATSDAAGTPGTPPAPQSGYKALIDLPMQQLDRAGGAPLRLLPGMQVIAEINQGQRTVLEYLLSPLQRAFRDSARER